MPTAGLSLVAFMDQPMAMAHLRNQCVPADPSDAAILAEWRAAKQKRGGPTPNAGHPDIQELPAGAVGHIQQLQAAAWVSPVFAAGGPLHGSEFKLIEIDPLLAYQFAIDGDRSQHHAGTLSNPPTLDEQLNLCLPLTPARETFQTFPSQSGMLLKARSLNLRSFGGGIFNAAFMGIQFGVSLPFFQVVRHDGRCYLHNGFHRGLCMRAAGMTHAPCIFRDVADHASVGIRADNSTFGAQLLESNDPPTLAHFTQGKAYDVQLRIVARYMHVSWADYVLPEE